MAGPESKEEKDYCDWLNAGPYSALAIKLVLFTGGGFPDRTVVAESGIIFFIEFKRPDKKNGQQRRQSYWHKILQRLGFNYYVCYTTEEAIKISIKEMEGT
tara:strand:- start:975 stop:1277 length:303 start_codon:yes stop_codon:yes gene_type:complete